MAKSVLDIIIRLEKQGGADKDAVKGLVNLKKGILDAAAVGGTLVAAGIAIKKVLDETLGTFVEYADKVRRIQDATGQTAEESSKLIQVLDDEKVSYEALEKAVAKSGKTFDFSINGLAKMSDEYLSLQTTQEKAAFAQERFGKQWISFVPVLEKGSKALQDNADAISGGLVLTQEAVDNAREYEIAMDALSDAWEGAKVSAGSFIGELLVESQALDRHKDLYEEYTGKLVQLGQTQGIAAENFQAFRAQMERGEAMTALFNQRLQEQADTINEAVVPSYETLLSMSQSLMGASDEQTAKIVYNNFLQKISVDGITEAEMAMANQLAINSGIFDEKAAQNAANINLLTDAVINGKLSAEDLGRAINNLPSHKDINIVLRAVAVLSQQGGSGAAQAAMQQELNPGGNRTGYAAGGIATGPSSGHWELLHGAEAVIPLENGSVPVQMQGGGNITVNLTIASPMTIMDQQNAQNTLLPFIISGLREAKARGAL